jgi:cytochrome o ubiquinol oxidase subunit II
MLRLLKVLSASVATLSLGACGLASSPVLDPKGPITLIERDLMFETFAIMMIVLVIVWLLAIWFVIRYRASNAKARYQPYWESTGLDAVVWLIPAAIIVILGVYVWNYTHKLDPYKQLEANTKPFVVEVVAQDWKWLFLYPEQGVATVNELVFPSGVPLTLIITSDTAMNSFYVPALGSQIYAMAGMETELNLLAWEPGKFVGRNSQYSGAGFSDQHFDVVAVSRDDLETWLENVRQSPLTLDAKAYEELAKPSKLHPITHYASYEDGLYDSIVAKYMHAPGMQNGAVTAVED